MTILFTVLVKPYIQVQFTGGQEIRLTPIMCACPDCVTQG